MPIDGRERHHISLEDARRLTRRFRERGRPGAGPPVRAHAVSRGVIDEILAQPGCLGLRMYHAVDDAGAETLVIVGVDANDADLSGGVIAEQTRPCPPICAGGEALGGTE